MHCYELEVSKAGIKSYLKVEAKTRTQAAKMARDQGFVVMSVNMIG